MKESGNSISPPELPDYGDWVDAWCVYELARTLVNWCGVDGKNGRGDYRRMIMVEELVNGSDGAGDGKNDDGAGGDE